MYRPYNAKVLVGNWYEDRVLEEVGVLIAIWGEGVLIEIYSILGCD